MYEQFAKNMRYNMYIIPGYNSDWRLRCNFSLKNLVYRVICIFAVLNIWREDTHVMDIQVEADSELAVIRKLNLKEIPYTVVISDVHACIQVQQAQIVAAGNLFKMNLKFYSNTLFLLSSQSLWNPF